MNKIGEILILSRRQKLIITESLRDCKGCFFNSSSGCRKSVYLPEDYTCRSEDRLDNKNIIYKRIK
jgi:hypothetical protein